MTAIKLVLGGGAFFSQAGWEPKAVQSFLDALAAGEVKEIDTAQVYGESELVLGNNDASARFDISTKIPGVMVPGSFRREQVVSSTRQSLEKLKIKQLDVLYLHSPDPSIPIEETLAGIQDLYADGVFRRFGISNYAPDEVKLIHDHQKQKGWVLPTVFQGNYNPVARTYETDLFPILKELGIAFYAYSPVAGGFLTKTKQQVLDGAGRFNKSAGQLADLYNALYNRPSLLDALEVWHQIAKDAGTSSYNLAVRWVTFNSALKPEHGDAVIVGAGTVERLQDVFDGVKQGPLSDDIVRRIDALWRSVKHEAPVDNISVMTNKK